MKTKTEKSCDGRSDKSVAAILVAFAGVLFFQPLYALGTGMTWPEDHVTYDLSPAEAVCQQDTAQTGHFWFDVGYGLSVAGSALDLGLSVGTKTNQFLAIRYSRASTTRFVYDYSWGFTTAKYPMGKTAGAFEITYGFLTREKEGLANFSIGLGFAGIQSGEGKLEPEPATLFTSSTVPRDYKKTRTSAVGLVLRGQVIVPWGVAGIGISPSININNKYTYASITLQGAIGQFKAKAR